MESTFVTSVPIVEMIRVDGAFFLDADWGAAM